MAFTGVLITNTSNSTTLDNSILAEDGYKSNPDMQQDQDSYNDDNGDLQRSILPHVRQKIWLKTNEISSTQKKHLQTVFPSRTTVTLQFWNDEREAYMTATFYIPDIDWTIRRINKDTNERTYAPVEITLISYGEEAAS